MKQAKNILKISECISKELKSTAFIAPKIVLDWDSEIRSSILYMHLWILRLILQGAVTQLGQLLEM